MPTPLDEPLYLTSVKLFAADVEWLQKTYGPGWTGAVRDIVRNAMPKKPRNEIDIIMEEPS